MPKVKITCGDIGVELDDDNGSLDDLREKAHKDIGRTAKKILKDDQHNYHG